MGRVLNELTIGQLRALQHAVALAIEAGELRGESPPPFGASLVVTPDEVGVSWDNSLWIWVGAGASA
jgi:hypothetical protein